MDISVALDGSRQRDLSFFTGDEQTLNLTVYAVDGDFEPIDPATITTPRILTCWGNGYTIPVGTEFTVPDRYCGRVPYRLVAEVAGVTTTLAYGTLNTLGRGRGWCGRWDYGGPWGWGYAWQ